MLTEQCVDFTMSLPAGKLTSQLSADIRLMSYEETQASGADESVCRLFWSLCVLKLIIKVDVYGLFS